MNPSQDLCNRAHLQVSEGTPAIIIRRRYVAENGRVVETAFSYYPIGLFEYRNVLLRKKWRERVV